MATLLDADEIQEINYLYAYGHSKRLLCKMFKIGIQTLNKVLDGKYKISRFDKPIGDYEEAG